MPINPILPSEFDLACQRTTPQVTSPADDSDFRKAIKLAHSSPIEFTKLGENEFRVSNSSPPGEGAPSAPCDSSDTIESSCPGPIPPTAHFFHFPSPGFVPSKVVQEVKSIATDIGTRLVAHIKSIQNAYQTIEFDVPESQIKVRFSTIGETSKIQIQTADPDLQFGLNEYKNTLVTIIKQAINTDHIAIQIEGQPQSQHSGHGNKGQDHPPKNSESNDSGGTDEDPA